MSQQANGEKHYHFIRAPHSCILTTVQPILAENHCCSLACKKKDTNLDNTVVFLLQQEDKQLQSMVKPPVSTLLLSVSRQQDWMPHTQFLSNKTSCTAMQYAIISCFYQCKKVPIYFVIRHYCLALMLFPVKSMGVFSLTVLEQHYTHSTFALFKRSLLWLLRDIVPGVLRLFCFSVCQCYICI